MRKMLVLGMFCAMVASACGEAPGRGGQGRVLAWIDGDAITEEMLRKEIEGLPPYVRPILDTPAGQTRFLESVITRDLLMREALRRGLDRRPDVASQLSRTRKSILLEALWKDVAQTAPVPSDDELRRIYDSSREQFRTGPRVKVSHMLFRDPARAEEMRRRAGEGEPFEALMKETAGFGGEVAADLGYIERGSYVREFEAAAFAASVGEVVGPVKTRYGYHVIKVYARRPAGVRSFEDVKPQIAAERREAAQAGIVEAFIVDLRKKSDIRILAGTEPGEPAAPAGSSPGK